MQHNVYKYWISMLYTWNYYNILNQLYNYWKKKNMG